jgi:hypothetical protein
MWRYAGFVLGVHEDLLTATIEEQEVLALQLTTHLYQPTRDSEALAKALLRDMSARPPFMLSYEQLLAFSRYLVGDKVADDLNIHSTVSTAAVVRMVKAALALGSVGQQFLPDFVLRRIEAWNHDLGRRTLQQGLGQNPASWGFKAIA